MPCWKHFLYCSDLDNMMNVDSTYTSLQVGSRTSCVSTVIVLRNQLLYFRSTQPPIPIIPENIVVELDSPALKSELLVLPGITFLLQSRLLALGQACEVSIVKLISNRRRKLSFQLPKCPPLHGFHVTLRLFDILYPCFLSHARSGLRPCSRAHRRPTRGRA